jgi:hypothetical protein
VPVGRVFGEFEAGEEMEVFEVYGSIETGRGGGEYLKLAIKKANRGDVIT